MLICSIAACSCATSPEDSTFGPVDDGPDGASTEASPPWEVFPSPDTGTDIGGDVIVERRIGALVAVNASTAFESAYFCLGAFLPTDDPAAKERPLAAFGPIGTRDPSAPADPKRIAPLRWGDAVWEAVPDPSAAAFANFTVVIWLETMNPATSGKTCADTWRDAKMRLPLRALPRNTFDPSVETLAIGATDAPAADIRIVRLPRKPGATPTLQTVHWSAAALGTVDLHLRPATGELVSLARDATYGAVAPPAPIASGESIRDARFIIAKAGTPPCDTPDGAPTDACRAWSPRIDATSTTVIGSGPANALLWFGTPGIATRFVWIGQ